MDEIALYFPKFTFWKTSSSITDIPISPLPPPSLSLLLLPTMYAKKIFRLPPGASARVITFLPHTRGLVEYAGHLGLQTRMGTVETAISMALVAFGQHPDHHPDVRVRLRDLFGYKRYSNMEPETVPERIARFGAPKNVKTASNLVEWYMESIFPRSDVDLSILMAWSDDEHDDDNNKNHDAQISSTQRKRRAATAFSGVDGNDEDTRTPAQKQRCAAIASSNDDAGNDEVDDDETEYDETEDDEEEGDDSHESSGSPGPSPERQRTDL
ncbi:hypothetical protein F4680DRAFT_340378 [Xylaria scruposa]|nr:hypothetical protein F4680DRAFT_340378 [Xylaria scruposa]